MKIIIKREICIGASACVAMAPKIFALDKQGKSTVLDSKGNLKEEIQRAVLACPTEAIKLKRVQD